MHRFLLSFSMAVLAMPATAATALEPAAPLTLPAALNLALQANPDLSAAQHELDALGGATLQAQALPNPELQTLVEDSRKASRTSTLQLNQLVELGGKRAARIKVAQQEQSAAQAELAARRADTRAAVIGAFFDVLSAQQGLSLADSSSALAHRASDITGRRVIAGKASPVEETRARVAEASVRLDWNLARSALNTARQRLAALWGNPAPRFTMAEGALEQLPDLPPPEQLAQRLEQAPAMLKARSELARRQAMADLENRRRMPDLTVSVGIKRPEELGRNQAIIGVSVPLPWFDRNQGNLLEALRRGDKARDELAATAIRTHTGLAEASERLAGARHQVNALQNDILPGAQSAYDAASKGFEFGKFAFLDVLDAQRTLLQAKSQYLRALSEAHQAAAEIDRILGATE
ncbi:TolC family protein [Janthinobacterium agaricidamnosum]|uniref:Cobalt-zinc-cadmium resistance protein CzcC n=1 Tax=Janthinobacterium agaricidamnosum NBRC 102515 = DSM 9628 TaxID=1349767 RepID=W0VCH5_9BURK|nr:TolC family protein [Janthinobacterium agaricidamnosum]CDG85370.1 cobalt-zinc-cadmium resistance protein CzcC [Janthinobacterium agaricidamnosum NBRC 102515 = DSM 9628]